MSAQERLAVARETLRAAQDRLARAERGRYGDNPEWRAALDAVSVATVEHARLRREAMREEGAS